MDRPVAERMSKKPCRSMRRRPSNTQPRISMTMRRSSILSMLGFSGRHSDVVRPTAVSGGSTGEPPVASEHVAGRGFGVGSTLVGSRTAGGLMCVISL